MILIKKDKINYILCIAILVFTAFGCIKNKKNLADYIIPKESEKKFKSILGFSGLIKYKIKKNENHVVLESYTFDDLGDLRHFNKMKVYDSIAILTDYINYMRNGDTIKFEIIDSVKYSLNKNKQRLVTKNKFQSSPNILQLDTFYFKNELDNLIFEGYVIKAYGQGIDTSKFIYNFEKGTGIKKSFYYKKDSLIKKKIYF